MLLGPHAFAAEIDSRAYSCAPRQSVIAAKGCVFIGQPSFGDFAVANGAFCGGGEILQPAQRADRRSTRLSPQAKGFELASEDLLGFDFALVRFGFAQQPGLDALGRCGFGERSVMRRLPLVVIRNIARDRPAQLFRNHGCPFIRLRLAPQRAPSQPDPASPQNATEPAG